MASEEGQQIAVATHSPTFVSRSIEEIPALVRLKRDRGVTQGFQVSEDTREIVMQQNNELAQLLRSKLDDPAVDDETKKRICDILGETEHARRMEEEAIRYLLWLDSERCCAFFADIVLICEGATEKVFIDYLIKNEWNDLREKRTYVLDAMGKYNIHRYMNLFKELGIYHSVLADKDENRNVHAYVNQFIQEQRNEFTKSVDFFDKDIETFLGVTTLSGEQRYKRPLNVMWHYFKDRIPQHRIDELRDKVGALL